MLSLALQLGGFDTHEARDGLEAITMLEWAALDAVVLDIMLPGLDGLAVHAELVAHPRNSALPIVVVSGSEVSLDRLHVACILRKPVAPGQVVAAVVKCTAGGASAPVF